MKKFQGFTLVELLIVISIVAVLAVVGVTVFRGASANARDSRRKADVEAIAKAYEVKYSGSYQALTSNDFSSGIVPQPPEGGSYYNNLATDNSGFRVCAALEANPLRICSSPSSNCICVNSSQSSYVSNGSNGVPPDSPSSCDPNGTLSTGLIGYWKLNGSASDFSGRGNNGVPYGGVAYSNDTPNSNPNFGQSASFDGIDDYISLNLASVFPLFNTIHGPSAVSLWFKPNVLTGDSDLFSDSCTEFGVNQFNAGIRGIAYNWINSGGITTTNWYHIVVTHEHPTGLTGTKVRVYLNSVQVGSTSNLDITASQNGYMDNPFSIGVDGNPTCHAASFFNGLIDEVRLYNRALTGGYAGSEISSLYNGGNGCIP